ncbi:MAG: hypothetical protein IPM45_12425 [Acidimicrobiales bacterium]|nr:hypothetical protein [Acidimicrobiales bacterium]
MADIVFAAVTVAFFLLCAGYVMVCDRIVGPDPVEPELTDSERAASAAHTVQRVEAQP